MGYITTPAGVFFRIRTLVIKISMNLFNYFKETQAELKEVKFPSLAQTIMYTVAVIVISILVAVLLGAVDLGLKEGLIKLLAR